MIIHLIWIIYLVDESNEMNSVWNTNIFLVDIQWHTYMYVIVINLCILGYVILWILMFIYSVVGTTREQLGFALCLQVPIFVVVTKVDSCRSAILEKNLSNMEQLLKSPGSNKIPTRITSESDAVNAAMNMNTER